MGAYQMTTSLALLVWGGLLLLCLWLLLWRWLRPCLRHPLPARSILISGCDSGIGRAAALYLAQEGARVFAGCLTAEGMASLQQEAELRAQPAAGGRSCGLVAFLLDVTSSDSISNAVALASSHLGAGHGLDVLLSNAGCMAPASLVELTPLASFQRNMDVNFMGAVRMTQAFMPLLLQAAERRKDRNCGRVGSGPRIVLVSSFLGRLSPFSLSAYSSSKFALEAFAASLRAELRSRGIGVVILQPGTTRTELGGAMRQGMEHCWRQAGEDKRQELGERYRTAMERSSWMLDLFGRPVSNLLGEVEEAVCAWWPKSRYVCGWDSFLFGQLLPLLPTWLSDAGCLLVLGWPRPTSTPTPAPLPRSSAPAAEQVHPTVPARQHADQVAIQRPRLVAHRQ